MRLLLVSPCIEEEFFGGVQLTARLAWEGFSRRCSADRIRMLCYGPRCGLSNNNSGNRSCSHSRAGAAFDALQARGWADELLFWHVDLLKLLPFLGNGARRKYLFLHGIECWRQFDRFTIRLLDRIDMFLTNSEFTWNRFIEIHPRWKNAAHRTVRLGVGVPEPRLEPPGQVPAAVIIGRMNASEGYKGHRELIEAWPLVLERIPSAELWIVGGGDGSGALRNLASEGTASRQIRFCGVVSDEEKQNLLRQARCMVLPSRGEGFGLVYLEAMRLGRPCLSSIHDAGQEVIGPGNAGIAVEPGDPSALAEAVAKLVGTDCTWEQWSSSARRSYESQFTAAHFQQRLLEAVLEGQVQ